MVTPGSRNASEWAKYQRGDTTAGPKYSTWDRFEEWLKQSEMTEVDFTVEFGLGFYATREWKRRDRVPLWAVVALSRSSRIRQAGVLNVDNSDVEATLATTFLGPGDLDEWERINARRKELMDKALLTKQADEQLAGMSMQKLRATAAEAKPDDLDI